jgi:SNF2 family DNA or RNA helicase
MLRRTKAQVAPELPPRTEDIILVDLDGEQRSLYDAELKRARSQLMGVDTNTALAAVRERGYSIAVANVRPDLLEILERLVDEPGTIDAVRARDAAIREMTQGGFGFHPTWSNLPRWIQKLNIDDIKRISTYGQNKKT